MAHNIHFDPKSAAADDARRKAQALEDELLTQEAIAEMDASGIHQPGITSIEEIPGRDDLVIANGKGFGGCNFSMLAPNPSGPAPVVQESAETHEEVEAEATQAVGGEKKP